MRGLLSGVEISVDDLAAVVRVPDSGLTDTGKFVYAYLDERRQTIVFVYEHSGLERMGEMRIYDGEVSHEQSRDKP